MGCGSEVSVIHARTQEIVEMCVWKIKQYDRHAYMNVISLTQTITQT